jgi:hypothetical protein
VYSDIPVRDVIYTMNILEYLVLMPEYCFGVLRQGSCLSNYCMRMPSDIYMFSIRSTSYLATVVTSERGLHVDFIVVLNYALTCKCMTNDQ